MSTIAEMPYPIAVPWQRVREAVERDPSTRWERLVQLHDALLRTVALVSVSAYIAQDARIPAIDKVVRDGALGPRISTGSWYEIVHTTLAAWARTPERFPLPELVRAWVDAAGTPSGVAKKLADFIPLRNRSAHPGIADDEKRRLLPALTADFTAILDGLACLTRWRFAAVTRASERRIDEYVLCTGTRLERVVAVLEASTPVEPDDLLLLDGDRELLRLYPMYFADLDEELFAYDANRRAARAGGVVSRIDYIGIASLDKLHVNRTHAMARALDAFTRRLGPWLAAAESAAVTTFDLGVAFEGMREAVARAASGVVGRDALIAAVEQSRGGVVCVEAPPGAGKTGALAAIAQRLDAAAVHLVARDGGRDDVRLIARALLGQLCARFGHRHRAIPDDLGGALKALHETLRELGESGQRVVVVIDALDELRPGAGGPDISLLPRATANIVVVVSSRPGDTAMAVREHGSERIELAPLDRDAMWLAARALAPLAADADLDAACAAAAGNPLFLRAILESRDATAIPASLEAAFDATVRRVRAAFPQLDVTRGLGLFAAARSGLSRRDLGRLLAAPFEARELLAALRPFLLDRRDRYVLFHARLREWLVDEYIDPATIAAHHGAIADLLARDLASGRDDSLADLPWHLGRAGRDAEILELLDGDFLVRKVALEGSIEIVRDDLLAGVRAARGDVVRAARYGLIAALLARGARALARRGFAAQLASTGDPRIAATLALLVPDPGERDAALADVAVAAVCVDAAFAGELAERIVDPELRARTIAAAAAIELAPADVDRDELLAAAAEAIAAIDRVLHVRALAAAAGGLEPELAAPLATRAISLALADHTTVRGVVLAIASAPLAGFEPDLARRLLAGVPAGIDRGRALAAAGLLDDARAEAAKLAGSDRDAVVVEIAMRVAAHDPHAALQLALTIAGTRDRDRALLAIATPGGGEVARDAAAAIADPALRAGALADVGLWDLAAKAAAGVDGEAGAAAHERVAIAAIEAGDGARAAEHRRTASSLRARLTKPREAAALREAAAIAAADPVHAKRALARASGLDTGHAATRETLVRSARLALAEPSGDNLARAIAETAPFGDAFADLFPDLVGALADGFGRTHPDAVLAAVEALRAAERHATFVLLAGMRHDAEPPIVPPPLASAIAAAIASATWTRAPRAVLGPAAEADLIARQLATSTDARDVDRLVELRLVLGDRTGAVTALLDVAARHARAADLAAAERARSRARAIDPLDHRVDQPLPEPAPLEPAAPAPAGRVVLCVDDSATIQRALAWSLGGDWHVVSAGSLAEARARIAELAPAIVLVEPELPDGSGYDLASELPATPTVLLCGTARYDSARGHAAGAAGWTAKPWDTQALLEKLDSVRATWSGQRVIVAAPPPPATPPATRSAATVLAPGLCTRCGKKNETHHKFCLHCGGELATSPAPAGPGDIGMMRTMMADPQPAFVSAPSPLGGPMGAGPLGGPMGAGPIGPMAAGRPPPIAPPLGAFPPGPPGFAPSVAPPAAPMPRCPSCGGDVPPTFRFCGTCGFRMDEAGAPMPSLPAGPSPMMGAPLAARMPPMIFPPASLPAPRSPTALPDDPTPPQGMPAIRPPRGVPTPPMGSNILTPARLPTVEPIDDPVHRAGSHAPDVDPPGVDPPTVINDPDVDPPEDPIRTADPPPAVEIDPAALAALAPAPVFVALPTIADPAGTPSSHEPPRRIELDEQLGNYRFVKKLAEDELAEVFEARHVATGQHVAVKVLRLSASEHEQDLQRFFQLTRAAAKVRHTGMCHVFDFGVHAGRAYIVMELLEGESLSARIRRAGAVPFAQVLEIGRQLASILDAAHSAGIVHGNLTPENVFVVPDAELARGERVKVLDFGVAKLKLADGSELGTPYTAPELWKSEPLAPSADAYSLGCILFEAATGRRPFLGDTIDELVAQHLSEQPARMSSITPVPAELERLVGQLLAKAPDDRPAMREIQRTIDRIRDAPVGMPSGPSPTVLDPSGDVGLIDIRGYPSKPVGSIDDLPVFGSAPFGELPLVDPTVVAPPPRIPLFAKVAIVTVLVLALAVLAYFLLR